MARRGSDKGTMTANVGAGEMTCVGDASANGVVGEAGDETAGVVAVGAFIGDVTMAGEEERNDVADTVVVGDGADAASGVAVWNCTGTTTAADGAAGDVVKDGGAATTAESIRSDSAKWTATGASSKPRSWLQSVIYMSFSMCKACSRVSSAAVASTRSC